MSKILTLKTQHRHVLSQFIYKKNAVLNGFQKKNSNIENII